jgi:hypothetical protein
MLVSQAVEKSADCNLRLGLWKRLEGKNLRTLENFMTKFSKNNNHILTFCFPLFPKKNEEISPENLEHRRYPRGRNL